MACTDAWCLRGCKCHFITISQGQCNPYTSRSGGTGIIDLISHQEISGSKHVLLLISSMEKSITWAYWKLLKLHVESNKKLKVQSICLQNRNNQHNKKTTLDGMHTYKQ